MSDKEIPKLPSLQSMTFEERQDFVGLFRLLYEIDQRLNPELYENNRDTNNTDKAE